MTDKFSPAVRSKIMAAIRSKNTRPEVAVRSSLHRLGYRYRLHAKELPGTPDIVLPKYRTAIQVRGCFWHAHICMRGRIPQSNSQFWEAKLSRNKERDKRNDRSLRKLGWSLIVVWECQCSSANKLQLTIKRISKRLASMEAGQSAR
jgi:DNA mismatch endonuclease (patch repair protein)